MITHELKLNVFDEKLKELNLSVEELADLLSIEYSTFTQWLRGGYPATEIRKLARTMNMSVKDFRRLLGLPEDDSLN